MTKKIRLTEAQWRVLSDYCPNTGRVGLNLKYCSRSFGITAHCLARDGFITLSPHTLTGCLITAKGLEYVRDKEGFFCRGRYTESFGLNRKAE